MTELPPGWVTAELGDVADTRLGKMLSQKAKVGTDPRPYLRNKSVQWGRIDVDDLPTMDFDPDELERFQVLDGDLLVCEGGEVGRSAIWRGQLDWVGYQKALHRVRPSAGVSPEFLFYTFMWLAQSNALDEYVTGSTIKHLPQEDLRRIVIPVPPLNEQQRIVSAIEHHLAGLDGAAASLIHAARLLEGLVLRSRALIDEVDAPRVSLGRLLAASPLFSDGDWIESKDQNPDGEVRLIQLADIGDGKFRDRSHRFLSRDTASRLGCTYLEAGDVLVARMPDPLGRACLFPDLPQAAVTAVDVCIIRPGDAIHPAWLMHALNAPNPRRQIGALQSGTTRKRISRKNLATILLRVPPLEEQRRIVGRVEEQLSAIDALRTEIDRAQRRSALLRRAILDRAFRGELEPQDLSNEPASILLERIRAERAAAPARLRRSTVRA